MSDRKGSFAFGQSTGSSSRRAPRGHALRAVLIAVAMVLPTMLAAGPALATADWPQARQNAERTGLATAPGAVITPQLLQTLTLTGAATSSPIVVDLDGDGANEVVAVADFLQGGPLITVQAYRQGASGLAPLWSFPVPLDPLAIPFAPLTGTAHLAAGDLDGDGKPEVAVYSDYVLGTGACTTLACLTPAVHNGRLTVLDGMTGAQVAALLNDVIVIGQPVPPAIGDVTGDGKPEVVIVRQTGGSGAAAGFYLLGANLTGSTLAVSFNTRTGTVPLNAAPALAELRAAHAGLEIVVGEDNFSNGRVYICTPSTGSANCSESVVTANNAVRGIAVGDLDGDGVKEIVANGKGDSALFITNSLAVIKTGAPLSAASLVQRNDGFLWNTPSLGDVDGDGKREIVNVLYSENLDDAKNGDVQVRGFTGTAITLEGSLGRAGPPSKQSRGGGSLADLDGDGRPELVFGSADGSLVAVRFTTASAPSLMWSLPLGSGTAAPFSPVAAGDVTGDGKVDLVVGGSDGRLYVVGPALSVPGVPTGLGASPGNAQVSLSWTAPANGGSAITSYRVYRGTAPGTAAFLSDTGSASPAYVDTTVTNGITYHYQVSAVNAQGEGGRSAEASATPMGGASPPSAPQGLQARPGDAKATLVWSPPLTEGGSPVGAYKMYRGTVSGVLVQVLSGGCAGLGAVLSCVDATVSNGVTYFYQVSAVNGIGEGPRSPEVSVRPAPAAPVQFKEYNAPTNLGDGAGEPGIGVNWATGNVFINSFPTLNLNPQAKNVKVLKAVFDDTQTPPGIAWTDTTGVVPPASYVNVDPVLFQDHIAGRIWAGGLTGLCSSLAYSDNDGQTWNPVTIPCSPPGWDHPTIGSGPWASPAPPGAMWPNASQPRGVYYCAQSGNLPPVGPGFCARSLDGGVTFTTTAPPWVPVNQCRGLHGHVRVAVDGSAYLANKNCSGKAAFSVTTNNGASWSVRTLPGTNGDGRFDPSVSPGAPNGWVYLGQAESDGAYIGVSKDRGATWEDVGTGNGAPPGTKAFRVSDLTTPRVQRAEFAEVIAGDDDRAAFAFLGSSNGAANSAACDASTGHVWYMYVAMTYDAGKTWAVHKASEDPVQLGAIGNSGACRDLLDFNDITVDKQGRVLVGYGDGCVFAVNGCRVGGSYTLSHRGEANSIATIARQYSGKGLFKAFDEGGDPVLPLAALPGGPYEGDVAAPAALAGNANGGTAPYTFTWSVDAKPAGSAAGPGSFSNPNAQSPTFTPDVVGAYALRLTVQDSLFGSASAVAAFTATPVLCGSGGVIIAKDSAADGGGAGTASEALCLRIRDDASKVVFELDLLGQGINGNVDSTHPLFFDFHFLLGHLDDIEPFLIEVAYNANGLSATYNDPITFAPIPGKAVTAAWAGNTLVVSTPRSELLSPANGQALNGVFVSINRCVGITASNQCIEDFAEDDVIPDAEDGVYVLGSSGGSGGVPIPECSAALLADPSGDSTAGAPGRGRRDVVAVSASDTPSTFSVCVRVANFGDAPAGAAPGGQSQYNVFLTAPYEAPNVAYGIQSIWNADGTLASAQFFKGVNGAGNAYQTLSAPPLLGGPATAKRVGDVLVMTVQKSAIGNPPDGAQATAFVANARDGDAANTFDRAPNTGQGASSFTFGQTVSDTTPPSQVTGLGVADPQTGTTLSLSWSAATDDVGVVSYQVKRGTASGGPYAVVGTPSGTSFTDTGLAAGTTYYYRVSAKDAASNEGPDSAEASGTPTHPTDTTPPTVPLNLMAAGTTPDSVTLSWSASSDPESGVQHYKVYRDGAHVASPTTTGYTDTGLAPDTTYTYRVSAVNGVGLESGQSAPLAVKTLPPAAFVTIDEPAAGEEVAPPATFKGSFSTTGAAPMAGGSILDAMPSAVQAYAAHPFVAAVLRSPEWAQVQGELIGIEGFLAAYPSPEGLIVVQLTGAKPASAPMLTANGWALAYQEHVSPRPMMSLVGEEHPERVFTLAQVEQMIADGSVLNGAPLTPTPGVQQGIGPGTGIQMANFDTTAPAGIKGFGCTASFLFENPATGKYYLSTAGHCLQDTNSNDASAATKSRWIKLCFRNCVNNLNSLGDYVLLEPDSAYPGYHPVAWARQAGIGHDTGLIEIPASIQSLLRPWMWFWGGPRGVTDFAVGDVGVHWGHGLATGTTFASGQGRAAVITSVSLSAPGAFGFAGLGAIWGGDSGSSISKAAARSDKVAAGDRASGILTHGNAIAGASLVAFMYGTRMARSLSLWENGSPGNPGLGFAPQLVTEDMDIRVPGAPPDPVLAATITSPAPGAAIDPAATPTVDVRGTATFPPGSAPGSGAVTYYLHRNSPGGCGATMERLWMDLVPSPVRETGTGCGSVRDPAGPVFANVVNITAQIFPTAPPSRTTSPILLDPTREVKAVVFLNASLNRTTNPAAPPGYVIVPGASVVNDLEVLVTYEVGGYTKEVGRQRLFPGPMLGEAPTPVEFRFLPQVSRIPANADVRLTFSVHESITHISTWYGGSTLSRLELPLGTAPNAMVQVSVDDAGFGAASQLAVTGTSGWSAPWSVAGLPSGPHTIYARAVQGTSVGPTVSVPVTITAVAGPTAAFTHNAAGLSVGFADTSSAGSAPIAAWLWDFGDGATSSQQDPTHTYAAAGTYTVSLKVTDANSRHDTASKQVEVTEGPAWRVDTRLTGPGGLAFDWTPVASPADGTAGFWQQSWAPNPDPGPGSYTLDARLLRNGQQVAGASRTFTVLDTNAPPVVDAGADQLASEGQLVSLQGSAADPNGDAFTVQWSQVQGPSVALSGADTLAASFTAPDLDADTLYRFRLTATDSKGAPGSDEVDVLVQDASRIAIDTIAGQPAGSQGAVQGTVGVAGSSSLSGGSGGANIAPTAVISDVVISGLSVAASGAGSFDPDGTVAGHAWALGNGDTRSGGSLSYAYPAAGTYTITLTVTDNQGAVGQAQFGPFTVVDPGTPLVVDAGDSSYVQRGQPITLAAQAFGNTANVAFAWDTDGDGTPDAGGQSIQVASAGRPAGKATFTVFGEEQGSGRQGSDQVNVFLYDVQSASQRFDQAVGPGLPDEAIGRTGQADGQTFAHEATIQPSATNLVATLRWGTFVHVLPDGNPSGITGGPNDFDLYAFSPGNAQNTRSAGFKPPEVVTVPGPVPGLWRFEVRSFLNGPDTYTLWVNATGGPPSPVPAADQVSQVCFTSAPQLLQASALVPSGAAVAGAWDLDNDGTFETSGLTAATNFPVGSGAHLVRFRATAGDYRDTILVAVRVAASCPTAPSVVVVAVADTGINAYADQFAGELVPYPELRAYTTADPANMGPGDTLVNHRVSGQLLPFTRHPSAYIPGFPASAPALQLTLGGGYYKGLDDARVWNQGHSVVLEKQWMWIPGTKIVAAVDATDDAGENGAPDPTPLHDDHGHGTASAAVAVGNTVGTCPRCVLAFVEGLNNEDWAEREPWIDFVSVSGSPRANLAVPDFGAEASFNVGRIAAERGQTISFAAGNGVANFFDVPEQTYLPGSNGPDWVIRVGAVQKTGSGNSATGGVVLGTGKPVDWSSYGAGDIPTSCRNSYAASCQHSGTSSATPVATGVMAEALLNARLAIGDGLAGQKGQAQAGGQRQAIAVGAPLPASPWLSDGVLTRGELWNVAFHCAADFGLPEPVFGLGPRSPADFLYGGYGIANDIASACATNALVSGGPIAARGHVDQFYAVDSVLREQFWGSWDGDGDGEPGGLPTGFKRPNLPGLDGLTLDDLASDAAVSQMWERILGPMGVASPVVESYWLHHTGGCAGEPVERAFMDRTNSDGDDDGCGAVSGASVVGELCCPSESFPSDVATVGFAAGAVVSGTVYIDYVRAGAPIVMVSLRADGVEIGRSAEMMPVALGGFGFLGFTAYEFAFPTLLPAAEGATLQLDVYITGSESYFFGYEGDHASGFTITGSGGDPPPTTPTATIQSPAQGAVLDASDGTVTVSGVATFPAGADATRAWLRYDETDGACGPRYLSLQDGPDAGNTCHKTAGIAGGILGLFDDFPADFDPVAMQPGGRVTGKLYFGAEGPSPGQMFLVLKGNGVTLGSQRVEFLALGLGDAVEVDVDFDLDGLATTTPVADIVFEVHIEQQGASQWVETEDPASYIDLPFLASPGGKEVQVSVDDPTFATGSLLAVSGLESWDAPWDLSGVAPGAHTLYARAGVGGSFGAASSVGVVVEDDGGQRTGTVQVQAVPAGQATSTAGWLPAAYDPDTGAWSIDLDTSGMANGLYDLHARLLGDGVEEARDVQPLEVANAHAPVLDPIGPRSVDEGQLLEFVVSATDADGDPLTFSASNLPDGAAFDPGTRTFTWTPTFQQAGEYPNVRFEVTDGSLSDFEDVTITVANVNTAPILDPIGPRSIDEGQLLEIVLSATDAEGDALTFHASGLPDGASFDPATRTFAWQPGFQQAGDYDVVFEVSDGALESSETVTITVLNVNTAPVLAAIGDRATSEGQSLSFTVSATDDEDDPLTFSAGALPPGAGFDPATRTFTWTPGFDQAGSYPGVVFTVSDGEASDEETITIAVANVNRAPVLAAIGDRATSEDQTLSFTVSGSDPDGDALTYSASNLPAGAAFDPATRTFTWKPGFDQAGSYPGVEFRVTDGAATDSEAITIAVANVNRAPVLAAIGDRATSEDQTLSFTVSGSDPDGDALTYSASNLPAGAAFDPATRTFTWKPGFDQAGSYPGVVFKVSDGALEASEAIAIAVANTLRPVVPNFAFAPSQPSTQTLIQFQDLSQDPDGRVSGYLWTFEPGKTSTEKDPKFKFATSGPKTVTLRVLFDGGTAHVEVSKALDVSNVKPTADFVWAPYTPATNTPVVFDGTGHDTDGIVVGYFWEFGDGTNSTLQDPVHVFADQGTYAVKLTVTDDSGNQGSVTKNVIVCHIALQPTPGIGFNLCIGSADEEAAPPGASVPRK